MAGADAKGHARLRHIEAIVNPKAGRCTPQTAAELLEIMQGFGRPIEVVSLEPADIEKALRQAAERRPDLVILVAGDGTARAAAEIFGADGPLLAPLPGGTMNLLPKALYGEADWREALRETMLHGVEREVGGGVVGDHTFYVAAMFGAAARFAPAREAAREHRPGEALVRARDAYRRAFAGRIRFQLDGHQAHKSQSLTLMCPMISRALDDEDRWMEAAAIDPHTPAEALRVGMRIALARVVGDWRTDPAVHVGRTRKGRVWAKFPIPALLDGEPVSLGREAAFEFRPRAFRALAPHPDLEDKV